MALITQNFTQSPQEQSCVIIDFAEAFRERAAHREFDGGESRPDAERNAARELVLQHMKSNRPHSQHPAYCSHCGGRSKTDQPFTWVKTAGFGVNVHNECLVEFMAAWRGRAVQEMIAAGISATAMGR